MEKRCRGCDRVFDSCALTHDGYCEECAEGSVCECHGE